MCYRRLYNGRTGRKIFFMDTLDRTDLQILRVLQENGRLTIKELASKVSLSSTPVYERLKRLEGNGYIKKYIAVLDAEKLNQGFIVFCNVKLKRMNRDIAKDFMQNFAEFGRMKDQDPGSPEVQNQVKKLQNYITDHMYQCTDEILESFSYLYEGGGEFTENIDAAGGEGTGAFAAKAIRIYCRNKK